MHKCFPSGNLLVTINPPSPTTLSVRDLLRQHSATK